MVINDQMEVVRISGSSVILIVLLPQMKGWALWWQKGDSEPTAWCGGE
jgi:hypothetical protein